MAKIESMLKEAEDKEEEEQETKVRTCDVELTEQNSARSLSTCWFHKSHMVTW